MANKKIVVTIRTQTLEAYESSKLVYKFDCVTGATDHPTMPGFFHVFSKDKIHRSRAYNAQMNYACFFSRDGKAIHQYHGLVPLGLVRIAKSSVSSWFGSHGCVRLAASDARAIFEWAPIGVLVHII